jgi:hypothetical protein
MCDLELIRADNIKNDHRKCGRLKQFVIIFDQKSEKNNQELSQCHATIVERGNLEKHVHEARVLIARVKYGKVRIIEVRRR